MSDDKTTEDDEKQAPRRRRASHAKAKAPAAEKEPAPAPLTPTDGEEPPIDNAVGYYISKAVNLSQLQAEITQASGVAVTNVALSGPHDPSQSISADNQASLWISPTMVDPATLAQVVADHLPNPDWGVPQVMLDFQTAFAKLRANPEVELTDADRDALLRGVALNFAAVLALGSQ